jgi:hypothetical protein
MAIIIFCYYTKQKERQGKNGKEATIVIPVWLFWLLYHQEPTTCAKFSAAHYQDLLVRESNDSISACSLYDWQWRQWRAVYDGYISSGKWVNERKTKGLP